jgi:aconitate hydratase
MNRLFTAKRFSTNPYKDTIRQLVAGGQSMPYYGLPELNDSRYAELPYSIRVLLESAVRNCDEFTVKGQDVENILDWHVN